MCTPELEHRHENDRARAPEHTRLPDRSSEHRHTAPVPDVAVEVVADVHGILGNQVLATAIAGGDLGGLEVAVGGGIGGAMAGMGASATGLFTSNQAMLRLLRSAGAVHDLVSPDPSHSPRRSTRTARTSTAAPASSPSKATSTASVGRVWAARTGNS